MKENIESIIKLIENAQDIHDLLYVIKPAVIGKGSIVAELNMKIKVAQPEEKKEIGKQLFAIKSSIEKSINEKILFFEEKEINEKLLTEKIDGSLPARSICMGTLHPITIVANQIIDIFKIYGFKLNDGFEIEDDWHNFTALNISKNHPARQMHDTFYLPGNLLLRTHTTSIDIRALIKNGAPIKSMSFGKTFRCDSDRTHSPMFHQFELLEINENLTMRDLKGFILLFLKAFFKKDNIKIRFRPSFFPFTEPSAEVDIGYCLRNEKIIIGEDVENFMEILGCGMLHTNVLRSCNVDSDRYNGIAFGLGVERLAMLKYGINDLRKFFESDINWLKSKPCS